MERVGGVLPLHVGILKELHLADTDVLELVKNRECSPDDSGLPGV